jgi:hypothetical protein
LYISSNSLDHTQQQKLFKWLWKMKFRLKFDSNH